MLKSKRPAKMGIDELLGNFNPESILKVKKIIFEGVGDKDVYNVSAPFTINAREYIAGRVESREHDLDSRIVFFVKERENEQSITYTVDKKAQILDLQDPFFSVIDKKFIMGGVKFPLTASGGFMTIFYRGDDVFNLEKFAQGPVGMKDIRMVQCGDKIHIFTRPQGAVGGLGRIGFMSLDSIESLPRLKDEQYVSAPLLNLPVKDQLWVGSNQVLVLKNGNLGVLGHVACVSNASEKNYYPMVFQLNLMTKEVSGMKIIARREDLPEGATKNQNLKNVIFPGGLIRQSNGTAKLYAGASDAEAYEITIKDPFLDYDGQKI